MEIVIVTIFQAPVKGTTLLPSVQTCICQSRLPQIPRPAHRMPARPLTNGVILCQWSTWAAIAVSRALQLAF